MPLTETFSNANYSMPFIYYICILLQSIWLSATYMIGIILIAQEIAPNHASSALKKSGTQISLVYLTKGNSRFVSI